MTAEDNSQLPSAGRLPAVITASDLPFLNEALAILFQELGIATALYQPNTKQGREGVIHSVEWVLKFLQLFAPVVSSPLHAPLSALFDALMSLSDGKTLPLLKPEKRSGRVQASALRQSLKGTVAFTVRRLTDTGMLAPAARNAVARVLNAEGVKPARGQAKNVTARTVRGWCEDASADVGRHGEAAQAYDLLIGNPQGETNELQPEQARAVLLGRLADVAKRLRAREGA